MVCNEAIITVTFLNNFKFSHFVRTIVCIAFFGTMNIRFTEKLNGFPNDLAQTNWEHGCPDLASKTRGSGTHGWAVKPRNHAWFVSFSTWLSKSYLRSMKFRQVQTVALSNGNNMLLFQLYNLGWQKCQYIIGSYCYLVNYSSNAVFHDLARSNWSQPYL